MYVKLDLVVFDVLSCVWKAIRFELLGHVSLNSLNYLVCSVAILFWICGVTALASAHDFSSFI